MCPRLKRKSHPQPGPPHDWAGSARSDAAIEVRWLQRLQTPVRFIETPVPWLQQPDQAERELAFAFVWHAIAIVSVDEMADLVDRFGLPRSGCALALAPEDKLLNDFVVLLWAES